ncbi:MAG TPA: PQQ-binding-like beta-propeller repeat protein [Euzebyales bacterium]
MAASADVASAPPPSIGDTVAGYRIEAHLTTDSVSSLHRAVPDGTDGATPLPVVLRVSRPLSDDEAGHLVATRYLRAVSAAVGVSHPTLVPILDAGRSDDRVYVATAAVDGVTLDRYVRDHGRLAHDDAVALLSDLAEALDHAHAAGVVHGAVSPRTIIVHGVGQNGPRISLRGFGIATLLTHRATTDRAAIDLADIAYVAPERLRGRAIDGRADQYSLACALHHCVTGGPPFQRDTAAGLFGAHMFSAVPVHPTLQTDADRDLVGALRAGMGKRPDQRHASCADLLRATGRTGSLRVAVGAAWSTGDIAVARNARDAAPPGSPAAAPSRNGRGPRTGRASRRAGRVAPGWPLATLAVMLGIISTLALASVVRDRDLDIVGVDLPDSVASGSLTAADDTPPAAGVAWQRAVGDEPLHDLRVVGDTAVTAAAHDVVAVAAGDGTRRWTRRIDIGVLTDIAVADDVVALRGAQFRGLSTRDGTRLWQQADIVAPINSLATAGGSIYGIGVGRVAPELLALDAETGGGVWSFDGDGQRIDDGAIVAATEDAVAMLDSETLWVLDPDGPVVRDSLGGGARPRARWQVQVDDPWLDSLALLPDVVVVADRSGDVCAYDPADGVPRWCEPVDGIAEQAPTIIADRDTVVAVVGSGATALSIESGARRWEFEAERELTPIATSTGRHVIVSDVGGGARGLDLATGYEVWRASGFGRITSLAGTPDAVYAGTRDGLLVRLEPPLADTTS